MLKKEYLVEELQDFLKITQQGLEKKSLTENWQFKLIKSSTAGRPKKSYIFSSFPLKLQMAIIAKVYQPAEKQEIERTKKDLETITKYVNLAKQDAVYKKRLSKALAKEFILTEIKTLKAMIGENRGAINTFLTLYNGGKIEHQIGETNIYNIVSSLAERTIRAWQKEYKNGGISAFLPQEKQSKAIIDNNKDLQAWIIEKLQKHPWAPTNVLYRALLLEKGIQIGHTTFKSWVRGYKQENKLLLTAINNPDKFKSKYKAAFGRADMDITRPNQVWEIDSTISDVMLKGGRCTIIGIIDVFTRRASLHVANSSSAQSVADALVKAFLTLGMPENLKTDNGKDYVSSQITMALQTLGIKHQIMPPFSPEKKPFIERFFGTFNRDLLTMQGSYIGNSVAMRKEIESKKSFSQRFGGGKELEIELTKEELQNFCTNWVSEVYHNKKHAGLKQKTPNQMAAKSHILVLAAEQKRSIALLLQKRHIRIVSKQGVHIDGGCYISSSLAPYIGQEISVILNLSEWGMAYAFDKKMNFIGVLEDVERLGFKREEVAKATKQTQIKIQKEMKQEANALIREANKTNNLINSLLQNKAKEEAKTKEYLELDLRDTEEAFFEEDFKEQGANMVEEETRYQKVKRLESKENLSAEEEAWLQNYKKTDEYKIEQEYEEQGALLSHENSQHN